MKSLLAILCGVLCLLVASPAIAETSVARSRSVVRSGRASLFSARPVRSFRLVPVVVESPAPKVETKPETAVKASASASFGE